ncbi:efflux RND transporter periplasmic adaptor subunit [Psychroflexus sp. CAK57W]|uniref:efflux RND transporter periplasmic adaptor subunit n=1 Tax=Psychroflexus curvus TaxID=2873595 RepID=UPI001CCDEB0A|nr:efflux RND transporter periplasmic adaptor subunit [Psychroflexus curvus]MBZ9627903.1 efflux RND transporter periplasmic adaptor subunit [Psychroflexus curvus]MBZ9787580.1 efflux RND transporter periplasmic adaptor subunit [Psychroflexus curvus]
MKNKLSPIVLFAVLILSLAGCGEETQNENPQPEAVEVKVQKPVTSLPQRLNHKGKIQSSKSIGVQSRVASYVDKIFVDIGDAVSKNELLVKLNSDDLQARQAQISAQLEEIEATLENAEKDYERYKNLREKNSVSEKELESIRLKYKSVKSQKAAVESQLKEIKSELKYFNIRAPFEGVITSKLAQEGDLANPQTPILQMEVDNAFEFHFSVSERAISALRVGQDATVEISNGSQQIDAQISEFSSSSLNSGGQYVVKAELINKNNVELFSGQQAEIQLVTDVLDQGIFVPKSAVFRRGGLQGLFVVSPANKAMLRWVETGISYGDHTNILSGLSSDESIITSADSKLYNGMPVKY